MAHMHDEMVMFTYTMCLFMPVFSLTSVGSALMQSLEKAGHALVNTLVRNIILTFAYWVAAIYWPGLLGIGVVLIIIECFGGLAMILHGKIILDKVEKRETVAPSA